MRIAVLGAGSCFAMNLSRHLIDRGDEVLSISRSPMRSAPFTDGLEDETKFMYQQAHLVSQLDRVMRFLDSFEPEVIVNFAALCEVALSWEHPLDYYETNLMSLVRLTNELEKRKWFKRFVQIGSSEVYGSVDTPATETSPVKPSSPYAASKAVFDLHLRAIANHRSFPGLIVSPSNGYCEGQTLNRIIPKTIQSAFVGKKLTLQGGGVARKSYLHGDDISYAIILVMEKGVLGETYNVGPQEPISIRKLVERIAYKLSMQIDDICTIGPERLGQDSQYWLDSTKIKRLGWFQDVSLDAGLERMIGWFGNYPELGDMDSSYTHRP